MDEIYYLENSGLFVILNNKKNEKIEEEEFIEEDVKVPLFLTNWEVNYLVYNCKWKVFKVIQNFDFTETKEYEMYLSNTKSIEAQRRIHKKKEAMSKYGQIMQEDENLLNIIMSSIKCQLDHIPEYIQLEKEELTKMNTPFELADSPFHPENRNESIKYKVFHDLIIKNYYVMEGFKFGGDFLVYHQMPWKCHSEWIVSVSNGLDFIRPQQIVANTRLANNANKKWIVAKVDENDVISFMKLEFWNVKERKK
ncbi:tRNA endonuclease-like domain-containing protein [Rozella allomycis CSF55]|uniref:tRNA-intron lyase n=1 Tax=Rozella allomycis (strain CSF55) TaxID=988480 RepID=A0A075AZG0_ROZAC|nr:tRNA endonuclease-like domain-containing protein [Rozella allomycis CSF55]|eukprot:EPZ35622.1 tRNA endonuclease-like domain-containing protein [Rozella allomycis CSF55]